MSNIDNRPNQLQDGPEIVRRRTEEISAARYSVALLRTAETAQAAPQSSPEKMETVAPVVQLRDYQPVWVPEAPVAEAEVTPVVADVFAENDLDLAAIRAFVDQEAA